LAKKTTDTTSKPQPQPVGGGPTQLEIDSQGLVDYWKSVTNEDVRIAAEQAEKEPPARRLADWLSLIDQMADAVCIQHDRLVCCVIDYGVQCEEDERRYRPARAKAACAGLRPELDNTTTLISQILDESLKLVNGIHVHLSSMELLVAKQFQAGLYKLIEQLGVDIQSRRYMFDYDATFHTSESFTQDSVEFQNKIRQSYLAPLNEMTGVLRSQSVDGTQLVDDKIKKLVRQEAHAAIKSHLDDDAFVALYLSEGTADKVVHKLAKEGIKVKRDKIYRALERKGGIKKLVETESSKSIERKP